MTDARLSRMAVHTLLSLRDTYVVPQVSRVAVHALLPVSERVLGRVSMLVVEVLYAPNLGTEEPPPTGGVALAWWDGANHQPAAITTYWDGQAEQPITFDGWWDGSAIQPLARQGAP